MKQHATMNVLPSTQNQFTANATAYGFSFVIKQTKHMKKVLLLLMVLVSSICMVNAQNPVFFLSGDYTPPNSWNQSNAASMSTVAGTNIQTSTPNATGNKYFRFYSATSGGPVMVLQVPISKLLLVQHQLVV